MTLGQLRVAQQSEKARVGQPLGRLGVEGGLRRRGSSSQFIDPPQDFPKQAPGHGDFGQLERDLPAMAANFGPDLD